jgi:lysophospholipase L1-like esterase
MIVGDSITHGGEADYTWRYFVWKWFQSTNLKPEFVGPFVGTQEMDPAKPPQPPGIPSEPPEVDFGPRTKGGYALECEDEFTGGKGPGQIGEKGGCRHYSMWGRQAAQAKGTIREQVEKYKPNLILSLLGFNDVGWWVSDANGTVESMQEFVAEARKGNPNVHFVLGNIVERSFMDGRQDLVDNTLKFNKMLKEKCPEWSTKGSLVAYGDIAAHYSCGPKVPDLASYDGLHPNARGDIEIAYGFSIALHEFFKLGSAPMTLPKEDEFPKRDLSPPTGIVASGSPMGVKVTWKHVYGGQYSVRSRVKNSNQDWGEGNAMGPRFDTTFTAPGVEWEYQVRTIHGNMKGEWSTPPVSAIATRSTAPPPTQIKVWPEKEGFKLSFKPPGPKPNGKEWKINRFEVRYFDRDWPGAFICAYGARGPTEAVFENMRESVGHRHQMWMATWTDPEGGGEHRECRPVIVGVMEKPPTPKDVEVKIAEDGKSVKVQWKGDEKKAAGYIVQWRKKGGSDDEVGNGGRNENGEEDVTMEMEKDISCERLPDSLKKCEFWVVAVNGELESDRSDIATLAK